MITAGINELQGKFILKTVNFRAREAVIGFALNFHSTLLYYMDNSVKTIICFSCNGTLKINNNFKIHAYDIKPMRKHNGFFTVDKKSNFHIYQNTVKGWRRNVLRNTNFQQIGGHILINSLDNLLISSTIDQKLLFWDKSNMWKCQVVELSTQIKNFCFNEEEDRLIVQLLDDLCILKKQSNGWIIIQLYQNIKGQLVSSIKNGMIVVLSKTKMKKGKISIFQLNKTNNILQFIREYHIAGRDIGFQIGIYFSQETNQLFVKFGNYITVFKINDNNELIIQSKYWFEKNCIDDYEILVSLKGNFLTLCHAFSLSIVDHFDVMQIKQLRKLF